MPTTPTKAEKRVSLVNTLPQQQGQALDLMLLHFDSIRTEARKLGIEHSFIAGVQIDVTGYGSIKDTYEKVQPAE